MENCANGSCSKWPHTVAKFPLIWHRELKCVSFFFFFSKTSYDVLGVRYVSCNLRFHYLRSMRHTDNLYTCLFNSIVFICNLKQTRSGTSLFVTSYHDSATVSTLPLCSVWRRNFRISFDSLGLRCLTSIL